MSNPTFFFIAQPGNLSLKARVLAASLRRFSPAQTPIVACVPNGMDLDSNTMAAFDSLEVSVMNFEPELWRRFNYPIGNKVDASCLDFKTEKAVFLDSDIFVMKAFDPAPLLKGALGARSIMGMQCFRRKNAAAMSALIRQTTGIEKVDVKPQLQRIPTVRSIGFPMFNSGVVQFSTGQGIAERWRELLVAVMETQDIPVEFKVPFADQTSLSLLALEMGDRFSLAQNIWNTNVNSKNGIDDAVFLHYFRFLNLLAQPACYTLVEDIVRSLKSGHFNLLGELSLKDVSYFKKASKNEE